MKPPPFEYHAPRTIDEVLDLLAEHGDEAKVIAGGQSLVPLLSMRLARPAHLVDVNDVEGLAGIHDGDHHVRLGATTRERDAEQSALVRDRLPLFAEALPLIGHVSIRNRGTIGGSIAHADASAELPAVAVAMEADVIARSTRGERVVAAQDFFDGHFSTVLADDECVVEIRVPVGPPAGWAFDEVARRHGDFALVGVAAMVALDGGKIGEARLCFMGVGDRPVRVRSAEQLLVGVEPSSAALADAAREGVRDLEPASDIHGSSEFRRHLAEVTARRALTSAVSNAGDLS
jgi:aerobic carbon-monoxide dehydrogenase medium subunit